MLCCFINPPDFRNCEEYTALLFKASLNGRLSGRTCMLAPEGSPATSSRYTKQIYQQGKPLLPLARQQIGSEM